MLPFSGRDDSSEQRWLLLFLNLSERKWSQIRPIHCHTQGSLELEIISSFSAYFVRRCYSPEHFRVLVISLKLSGLDKFKIKTDSQLPGFPPIPLCPVSKCLQPDGCPCQECCLKDSVYRHLRQLCGGVKLLLFLIYVYLLSMFCPLLINPVLKPDATWFFSRSHLYPWWAGL